MATRPSRDLAFAEPSSRAYKAPTNRCRVWGRKASLTSASAAEKAAKLSLLPLAPSPRENLRAQVCIEEARSYFRDATKIPSATAEATTVVACNCNYIRALFQILPHPQIVANPKRSSA